MTRVKFFKANSIKNLEIDINDFIKEIEAKNNITILDIKHTINKINENHATDHYCCIIYKYD